ncbi:MAG TPA: 6-bladed beta-propeller [Longimicrobiaceae bacterium]|nr:6-bladed beta-propeller [Longimicrobiaceae bacterium]
MTLDGRGRIFVADDINHRVAVFRPDGRFLQFMGRRGNGPGEFQQPWLVATDTQDSVFVWDLGLSRITVFDNTLRYRRDFRIPPQWLVTGIEFLPNGRLLVAAYGPNEPGTLHVLDRNGTRRHTFGPRLGRQDLAGFEASLLGGYVDFSTSGQSIVYTNKSPYYIDFYAPSGQPRNRCVGRADWTTPPAQVVVRSSRTDALNWKRYVHSSGILDLGNGLFLNSIHDPVGDRRILHLLTSDCTLVGRVVFDHPLVIADRRGSKLVAVRNLEYPEVIVYDMRVLQRRVGTRVSRPAGPSQETQR